MLIPKTSGFTLIELVIVITIVSILASIAFPTYTEQMQKGRRADAKTTILTVASLQERFHSDNGFYGSINDLTGNPLLESEAGHYNMAIACTPNCAAASRPQQYTITAAPQAADPKCGSFTYNQSGTLVLVGATEDIAYCW